MLDLVILCLQTDRQTDCFTPSTCMRGKYRMQHRAFVTCTCFILLLALSLIIMPSPPGVYYTWYGWPERGGKKRTTFFQLPTQLFKKKSTHTHVHTHTHTHTLLCTYVVCIQLMQWSVKVVKLGSAHSHNACVASIVIEWLPCTNWAEVHISNWKW